MNSLNSMSAAAFMATSLICTDHQISADRCTRAASVSAREEIGAIQDAAETGAAKPGPAIGPRLVEVERRLNGGGERCFLRRKQVANLRAEGAGRHRDDVVAADDARTVEAVSPADQDLGGKAADRRGDGRDGHSRQVRADKLSGQDQDGTGLIETSAMDRPH